MQGVPESIPRTWRELHDWIEANWFPLLLGGAVALVAAGNVYQFLDHPWYVSDDSALFQHGGWYITQGATPYVDFWDLKPPLIYAVTTPLALLSGGNMHVLHVLSVLVGSAAIVGGVTLVGVLNHRLTDDGVASVAAGWTMFVVTTLYTYPWAGIRPKYMAFLFGAAALLLAVEDRPRYAGVAAAVAAGFWHLGAVYAGLVVAVGWHRTGRPGLRRTVAGGTLVAALVVLPFALAGALTPLFVEVVLTPIYGVERYTLAGRLLDPIYEIGYGVLVVPAGGYGVATAVRDDRERYWWVAAGGAAFLALFFLEMGGAIDAIPVTIFLALGVGYLVAETPSPSRRTLAVACVVLLVASSFYWNEMDPTPVRDEISDLKESVDTEPYASLPPDPEGVPSMEEIYWQQLRPDTCHYRLDHKQKAFVDRVDGTLLEPTCGAWPFDRPPLPWLVDQLMPR